MKNNRIKKFCICMSFLAAAATACGQPPEDAPVKVLEEKSGSVKKNTQKAEEYSAPDIETVLAAREIVLKGMEDKDIAFLTETIKLANLSMENLLLNNNLEQQLADSDSRSWKYFEEKGEIQIGWIYENEVWKKRAEYEEMTDEEFGKKFGEKVITDNRYDGEDFIDTMNNCKEIVNNEAMKKDFDRMAEYMNNALENHDAEDIMSMYEILHDMDYFLLRYGPVDVGKYTKDKSTVSKYYGVLTIYDGGKIW